MSDLLRQYQSYECGGDGYPWVWHDQHAVDIDGSLIFGRKAEQVARDTHAELHSAIKDLIREQAGHRCQRCGHPYRKGEHGNGKWSSCDEHCAHGGPIRIRFRDGGEDWEPVVMERPDAWVGQPNIAACEAQWRILTVHHLDEDKANCRWWNLAALCQQCHLRMQRAVVMGRPYHYEHSVWFQPYAAGFYAWKYLGEDLTREETLERLDELLALELRFNQEVLPI